VLDLVGRDWTQVDQEGWCRSTSVRIVDRSHAYVTDCDSNGQEWTPVGHVLVTVVSTVAGCKADGQGRAKPRSGDIRI
jgi:hypothetical protein